MATPKLLHLRSTVQGKLPAASAIQAGQIGVNYNAADPFLCIKDSAGVVRRIGGSSISSTAPSTPKPGELWVDVTAPTAPVLKVWNGTTWEIASGGTKSGTTAPTTASPGDTWVDLSGTAPVLKVYNGVTWNAVGGNPPTATTAAAGIVQLATAADVTAGASDRAVTAALLKNTVAAGAYTLPAATTSALGGIKVGTNLSVTSDGTLSANIAGALTYAGTIDATVAAPATPKTNGLYVSSKAGSISGSFTGASGSIAVGDWLLYDGAKWDVVQASAAVGDATTSSKGIVQLASATDITNGATGRVVDAAQLKVVNDAIATATGGGITGITGTAPITATGTGATRAIGIDAATTSAPGAMSAADKSKLDGIAAGAQVNVKPDWNAAAGNAAEILNKPTIPAAYVLSAATTSVLGGIKVGTGLGIQSDGTLSVSLTGALIFKGSKDPTAPAPTGPSTGDTYVFNKAGTAHASWTGIAGQSVSLHEVVAWDGAEWDLFGAVGSTSVTQINATGPLHATGTTTVALTVDAASNTDAGVVRLATDVEATAGTLETVAVNPKQLKANVPSSATTAKAGVVQLADSIAIGAGTAGRVVDAAQLKAATPDATESVKGIAEIATTAEVTTGTDDTRIVTPAKLKAYVATAVSDATTSAKGIVQLADAAAVTAGTTGRVVDAAQLKAAATPAATTTTAGTVQLADAAAITAGTAGRVVDAAQLKANVPADATEAVKGIVQLATAAETTTGTNATKAVHPAGLKVELDKKVADAPDGTADGTKQYVRQVVSAGGVHTKTWAAAAASGANVTTSDTAPTNPKAGDLWYDSTGGRTYVYYNDGNTSQWVDAAPQGGGGTSLWTQGAGSISPATATDLVAADGFKFPSVQLASADPNTLDDYEEGTWAVDIYGATTAGTCTYDARTARYVKIGRLVTVTVYASYTGHTGTGSLYLSLPFACGMDRASTTNFAIKSNTFAGSYIQGQARNGWNFLGFYAISNNGTIWSDLAFPAAGELCCTMTYEVA